MFFAGYLIGGIMAGAAVIGQHIVIKRQIKVIEEMKVKPEPKKEENDFSYLIQGKKPLGTIQFNDLLKGDSE